MGRALGVSGVHHDEWYLERFKTIFFQDAMSRLTIKTVQTPKQWTDFFAVKRFIYRDDPAAVFPLRRMEIQQLDRSNNPFYQHAEMEAFVCYRGDQPVGRIAAIVDRMHQDQYQDDVGFFGFFESIDDQDVVHELIKVATDWVTARGCRFVRGPVNPSMKGEFGILVQGHETPPKIMMAHTPLRYERHLLDEGFEVAKTFYSYRTIFSKQEEAFNAKVHDLEESNRKVLERFPQISFRQVTAETFEQTMREINELGNKVRSSVWGFVPLTTAELEFMINNLKRVIRYDMIFVAYYGQQLVGYIVNIPDVNWALKRTLGRWDWLRMIQLPYFIRRTPLTRVIAIGVDERFRTKGISTLLIQQLSDRHLEFDEWDFSWVAEDNVKSIRMIDRAMPMLQYKTYRLYQRPVS